MLKVINLLPKPRLAELHLADKFKIIQIFFWVSAASMILVVIALLGTRVYLVEHSASLNNEIEQLKTAVNKQENAELKKQILLVNNQLADFHTLSASTPVWSKVFFAFEKLVPEDVGIGSFSADTDQRRVDISGFATTRESVIELYNNLVADTANFTDVEYPLENIAKPTDVAFHFTFFVKPETLKQ